MFRKMIIVAGLTVLTMSLVIVAGAQEKYPSRPVDFICTWGVGGGADQMARTLGKCVEPILGVPLPVSNKPGASGNLGINDLLAGKSDGYTIAVLIADTLCTIPAGQARYKVDSIEWIVRVQVADSFLFVNSDSPFKTIQDLLKHAQANPGKLRVATLGFGTVDDLTIKYFDKMGYKMTNVPYPKPGERYASTLGGHTEVLYEQAGDVKQYVEAGQLKPLIIFAEKRYPAFPDVPCSAELGFDIQLPQFRGIVAKKGVPADRIRILAEALQQGMEMPQWKKFAEEFYCRTDSYLGPQDFTKWVKSEAATMDKLVKEFGLRK